MAQEIFLKFTDESQCWVHFKPIFLNFYMYFIVFSWYFLLIGLCWSIMNFAANFVVLQRAHLNKMAVIEIVRIRMPPIKWGHGQATLQLYLSLVGKLLVHRMHLLVNALCNNKWSHVRLHMYKHIKTVHKIQSRIFIWWRWSSSRCRTSVSRMIIFFRSPNPWSECIYDEPVRRKLF